MPVTGMMGTAPTSVSEFVMRTLYPFLFVGPLPVTGVILAAASDSDLRTIVSLPASYGE